MDAAFAHALAVTAIHNHFFHDHAPGVLHAHRRGRKAGCARACSESGVGRDPVSVRRAHARPIETFGGTSPSAGQIDTAAIETIVGQPAPVTPGRPEGDDRSRGFHAWHHDRRFDGADDLGGVRRGPINSH